MAHDRSPDDQQQPPPWNQYPGSGPIAPLPPSRRQRDVSVQVVGAVAAIVATLVLTLLIVSMRPSRTPAPAPRAPSTTEQTCTYRYLDCDATTTTGWPR